MSLEVRFYCIEGDLSSEYAFKMGFTIIHLKLTLTWKIHRIFNWLSKIQQVLDLNEEILVNLNFFYSTKPPSGRSSKRNSSVHSDTSLPEGVPPPAIDNVVSDDYKHLAMTHEDTSEGAVHCFQDEFGK